MSNCKRSFDNKQSSIFDLLSIKQTPASDAGRFRIIEDLRESLRTAIKNSPFSRHQIAGEMSHLLQETVTKEQIDSWTRESDEMNGRSSRHIPAEYLPAFCQVTGSRAPIEVMGRLCGAFVLPGPDALRAEIQKIEENIKAAHDQKRQRLALLKAIGGK